MRYWTLLTAACVLWAQAGLVGAADEVKKAEKPAEAKAKPAPAKPAKPDKVDAAPAPARAAREAAGWLGVRLSPVPVVLARHLGIEGGLMVSNLVKDSPADKAGLDRYDVIVSADAKAVEGQPGPFAQAIQAKKPGDPVRLMVFHRGQKKEVQAMLGQAPTNMAELALKYADDDLDNQWMDQLNFRTRVLRLGPDGQVIEVDPKEMMPRVREVLRGAGIPGGGSDMSISIVGNNARIQIRRNDNGKQIEVQQDEQGRITVKRTTAGPDGKGEKTATYDSMEALTKADPEAAKLLQDTRSNVKVTVHASGGTTTAPAELQMEIEKKVRDMQEQAERQAREARQKAREMGEQMHQRFQLQSPRVWVHGTGKGGEGFGWSSPGREFKIAPDGQIEVIIRKGSDQVSMTFKNRQEFKQKEPKLYAEFEKVLEK